MAKTKRYLLKSAWASSTFLKRSRHYRHQHFQNHQHININMSSSVHDLAREQTADGLVDVAVRAPLYKYAHIRGT